MSMLEMAQNARLASVQLATAGTEEKNKALVAVAKALQTASEDIFAANKIDLKAAEEAGLAAPVIKRLKFDAEKLAGVIAGINSLVGLSDPVGVTQSGTELDSGLELYRVTCPIGVIGVVFESRPDALVQISSLCLKSGNAALLKGGREALETNRALSRVIAAASEVAGMPKNWLQLMESRSEVSEMLKLDDYIDLIIPRGSNAFVKYIMDNTGIPVLGHADGICHIYVDDNADVDMAVKIIVDAKTQYVSVCNAAETMLVSRAIAESFLPKAAAALAAKGVRLIGCEETCKIIQAERATEEDWKTEYLDYVLSIRIVDNLDAAIAHINQYGSGHTDVIVTENQANACKFMDMVDSGNVFWNCSSRFADGFRYGLGAEVGISTNKIHARGPVGLEGLVIYKWKMYGHGQIVADYVEGRKKFTHRKLQ